MAGRRAVFLDRDDTIMLDTVYCKNPEDVRLMPGAAEGIRALAEAGFLIVIATNQSGLGRGYVTEEELNAVNQRLREELRNEGASYDALYYCPHRPDEGCECRKPKPGLLLKAATDLDIDLASSYTVGDREWDVQAGQAAGTRTVLITNGRPPRTTPMTADLIAHTLGDAARLIVDPSKSRKEVSP